MPIRIILPMIKYLRTAKLKNKTVLLRVDVNVPYDPATGHVTDDFRIQQIIPTIQFLQKNGNKVIVCGHLGRPEGKWNKEFSLRPVAVQLAHHLNYKFVETDHALPDYLINHLIFYKGNILEEGHLAQLTLSSPKDVLLLENLRFYPEEEENDTAFAKKLASLADVYVNDAFSVDHHPAASVSGVAKYLPSYAGLMLETEIKSLEVLLKKPKKPFVVMMGGVKISDKAKTLEYLGDRADKILLGGGLANLIFLAKDLEIGLSKVESEAKTIAWQLMKNYKDKIVLPVDVVVANKDMDKDSIRVTTPFDVHKNELILDCGPKTILLFANEIKKAKTLVWNGPLGHFEVKPFHTATMALAHLLGGRGKGHAYTLVGGGETVDAVRMAGQAHHIDHLSTGGGALLEFLAGKKLPGIEALK